MIVTFYLVQLNPWEAISSLKGNAGVDLEEGVGEVGISGYIGDSVESCDDFLKIVL